MTNMQNTTTDLTDAQFATIVFAVVRGNGGFWTKNVTGTVPVNTAKALEVRGYVRRGTEFGSYRVTEKARTAVGNY